ncbi:MAG: hypothetical protein NTW38_11335 [Candidatus Aminicenantes bacterium]|nr:hypothetical protein [Candidatus Aminicenantes bacterium]
MLPEKKGALTAIVLISAVFLGFALFADLPALHEGFLAADQATYFSIAQSLAYDHDLEYTKKDLVRYKEQFWAGPQGLFLKRIKTASGEKLFYAKSMAYALFAAPFVRVFGPNGPLVFHAVLIFLLLLMGFSYFALRNSPGLAVLKIGTFLFASVAGAYTLWLAPDFFNLFCVFAVLYLWLYKHRRIEVQAVAAPPESTPSASDPLDAPASDPAHAPVRKTFRARWTGFLLSDASDYCAAAIAGIVAYAKPPNVAVFGPLVLWTILKKRPFKAVLLVLVFALAFGALFGTNLLLTGDWNYQGGERKSFYFSFPYEHPGLTFDSARGRLMTSDGYLEHALYPARFVPINLFYFIFGRFSGMVWYFFPAFLALILFLIGKKSLDRWLLLAALFGEILIYVVLMPNNFGGGGGSLANRYFMGIYPLFFFLPRLKVRPGGIVVEWAAAALLIAPILLSPIQAAHSPAAHAKCFPFTLFPVELTLINDLPTNTNPTAFRQQWGEPLFQDRFLYFLNDNYNVKHQDENGWWTIGNRKLEFILRTSVPVREIVFHLLNNPRLENKITVWVGGSKKTVTLGPHMRAELRFPVGDGFRVDPARMYRVRIKAAKGSIPYFEDGKSDERRWLGVFFTPELISP